MSEECGKCEKQVYGVYHCIVCCADLNSAEDMRGHMGDCDKAVFLNPLLDN